MGGHFDPCKRSVSIQMSIFFKLYIEVSLMMSDHAISTSLSINSKLKTKWLPTIEYT